MSETIIENQMFSFEGKEFVWKGDYIIDLQKNNKYHRNSSILFGNEGYIRGILWVNGKSLALNFQE